MLRRQLKRLRSKYHQIDATLGKRPEKPDKVEPRIGRWLGRNTSAESVFTVETIIKDGLGVGLRIEKSQSTLD
ncbi:MAG: hypothetical protein GF344_01765 [Chitinivibrionales bacterium]|nr:hypothetical protein [Chitinivibrionales bacterium]MBD3355818.1 hypothetical protein [Chitinivibrionales bacterium]